MQEVRLASNRAVAEQLTQIAMQVIESPNKAQLALKARLTVELGYSVVELVLEDTTVPAEALMQEGANLLRSYWMDDASFVAKSPGAAAG